MVRCFVEGYQVWRLIVVVNKEGITCVNQCEENSSATPPPPSITFHSTPCHHLHHQYYCICVLHQKPTLPPVSPRATSIGAPRCAQFTAGGRSSAVVVVVVHVLLYTRYHKLYCSPAYQARRHRKALGDSPNRGKPAYQLVHPSK